MRAIVLLLFISMLAACSAGNGGPVVRIRWDPGQGVLGAFPDDALTRSDPTSRTGLRLEVPSGRFALTANLPPMYEDVFADLSTLDGSGTSAGMFLRFEGALDPASLRSGPETRTLDAPILLMVERGTEYEPWPYEARLIEGDATVIVEPMLPLPPRARVVVAVTRRLRSASPIAASRLNRGLQVRPRWRGELRTPNFHGKGTNGKTFAESWMASPEWALLDEERAVG